MSDGDPAASMVDTDSDSEQQVLWHFPVPLGVRILASTYFQG